MQSLTGRDLESIWRSPILVGSHLQPNTGVEYWSTVRSSSRTFDDWRGRAEILHREGGGPCHISQEETSNCYRGANGTSVDDFEKTLNEFTYVQYNPHGTEEYLHGIIKQPRRAVS